VVRLLLSGEPSHPALAGRRGSAVIVRSRVKRLSALLVLSLAAPACSEPVYAGKDGGEDAAAMLARDGGPTRPDASAKPDASAQNDAAAEERIPVNDSGPPTETSPDGATVQLASALPGWAEPLLGSYVARSYSFAQDKFGARVRLREFFLMEIVETDGPDAHVELKLQLCDSFGEGTAADVRTTFPLLTSRRVHRVLFGDNSWATQVPTVADGFTRAMPERCQGKEGTAVPKDPAQTWILGNTCLCPASVDTAPNKAEDCRIIDQDGDTKPGSTLGVVPKIFPLGPANLFVTTVNQTTFVNGTVDGEGQHHTAQVAVDQFGWQLGCEPAGCADISATPAPCPPARSKLELVPVDAPMTCGQLIADATTLFPTALPEYPASCP
jgi:hypothetical protein